MRRSRPVRCRAGRRPGFRRTGRRAAGGDRHGDMMPVRRAAGRRTDPVARPRGVSGVTAPARHRPVTSATSQWVFLPSGTPGRGPIRCEIAASAGRPDGPPRRAIHRQVADGRDQSTRPPGRPRVTHRTTTAVARQGDSREGRGPIDASRPGPGPRERPAVSPTGTSRAPRRCARSSGASAPLLVHAVRTAVDLGRPRSTRPRFGGLGAPVAAAQQALQSHTSTRSTPCCVACSAPTATSAGSRTPTNASTARSPRGSGPRRRPDHAVGTPVDPSTGTSDRAVRARARRRPPRRRHPHPRPDPPPGGCSPACGVPALGRPSRNARAATPESASPPRW